MDSSKFIIIGAKGQLGTALKELYPTATTLDRTVLDISNREAVQVYDWSRFETILNAAGYTNVDEAETNTGRVAAWQANANAVRNLTEIANHYHLNLVHVSTDYVFDGTHETHTETEPFSPLGVYAQTKAAGDIAASLAEKHYILRVSWVIGSGKNFVRSIAGLADRDISPNVVADQFGRLTFTAEIARAIDHLLTQKAPCGTYNLSNGGDIVSWADIAREVYRQLGRDDLTVSDTTASEYFAGKLSSPRPVHSGLDLAKIQAVGFTPRDWRENLAEYLHTLEKE